MTQMGGGGAGAGIVKYTLKTDIIKNILAISE